MFQPIVQFCRNINLLFFVELQMNQLLPHHNIFCINMRMLVQVEKHRDLKHNLTWSNRTFTGKRTSNLNFKTLTYFSSFCNIFPVCWIWICLLLFSKNPKTFPCLRTMTRWNLLLSDSCSLYCHFSLLFDRRFSIVYDFVGASRQATVLPREKLNFYSMATCGDVIKHFSLSNFPFSSL